ncbi:unnamed protein product [Macrosiphum euphorbiae]|uniref:Uncharacterized protein n=1 Tax=Macrosiphum euphorbiae TaxID=13131 RepID=A0AAV0Y6K9_9HEMI|nr:unnamed protein product [Macrosiphum euphorbiae]CAI6376444.1 unnamed protein product [Macrosiphum euphorbiae]
MVMAHPQRPKTNQRIGQNRTTHVENSARMSALNRAYTERRNETRATLGLDYMSQRLVRAAITTPAVTTIVEACRDLAGL